MRDIEIKIDENGYAKYIEHFIGNQYENDASQLVFDLPKGYVGKDYYQYAVFTLSNDKAIVRKIVDSKCIIDRDITNVAGLTLIQVIVKTIEGADDLSDGLVICSQPISCYIKPASYSSDKITNESIDKNIIVLLDEFDTLLAEIRTADNRFKAITDANNNMTEVIDARDGYKVLKNRLDAMMKSITVNEANTSINYKNINALKNKVESIVNGAPLVVSSIDDMTDTTRVYVNTVDGNWYYYNGETWIIGGVYQASEDSKTLNKLEEEIENITDDIYEKKTNIDIFTMGTIAVDGLWDSTVRFRTIRYISKNVDYIIAKEGYKFLVFIYDEYNNALGRWNGSSFSKEDDAVWVTKFDMSLVRNYNVKISVKNENETELSETDFVNILFCEYKTKSATINQLITQDEKFYEKLENTAVFACATYGFVYIAPNSENELYTYSIKLKKGQKVKIEATNINRCYIVAYYKDGITIKENTETGSHQTILADSVISYNNALTEYTLDYTATNEIETLYLFLGSNQEPNLSVKFVLNHNIIVNENFDIVNNGNQKVSYFIPEEQTDEYANNELKSTDVFALYDEMLGVKSDGYKISKELLGKDQSETYDIYKYIFEPKNYSRSILISTGMHGQEIVPIFTLLVMLQNIVNNPSKTELYKYLRNNVRIIIVPIYNPWGFNQTPRVYPNSRLVNPNRNFGIKEEWENFDAPAYGTESNPYQGKGTAPFSEAETTIMRNVVEEYKDEIDFWFDCHTSEGWDYDYYVQCNSNDKYMYEAISSALTNIESYLNNELSISSVKGLFNDPDTALKLHYAYKILNVSCCTVEMTPERFGGEECGSEDLKNYLLHFCSYLIGALNGFNDNTRINNNHKYTNDREYIILKSPNGTRYQFMIDDNGNVITKEV